MIQDYKLNGKFFTCSLAEFFPRNNLLKSGCAYYVKVDIHEQKKKIK